MSRQIEKERKKNIMAFSIVGLILFILFCTTRPVPDPRFLSDYASLDESGVTINCSDLVKTNDLSARGLFWDHDRTYYKNIHLYIKTTGYKFTSCKQEIDENLVSMCKRFTNSLNKYFPSSISFIDDYTPYCQAEWAAYISDYKSPIVFDKNNNSMLKQVDYNGNSEFINTKMIISIKKDYLKSLNFWRVTLVLGIDNDSDERYYTFAFTNEKDADDSIAQVQRAML